MDPHMFRGLGRGIAALIGLAALLGIVAGALIF